MNWAKYAGILGAIAILYAMYWGIDDNGYDRGRLEVQSKWDKEKADLSEEMVKAAAKNQKRIAELEKTKNANIKTIDDLRADIAGFGVRVPQGPCPGPNTTSGGGDAVATGGEPVNPAQSAFDDFRRGVESDAAGADKIIESCRVVSDWVKGLRSK